MFQRINWFRWLCWQSFLCLVTHCVVSAQEIIHVTGDDLGVAGGKDKMVFGRVCEDPRWIAEMVVEWRPDSATCGLVGLSFELSYDRNVAELRAITEVEGGPAIRAWFPSNNFDLVAWAETENDKPFPTGAIFKLLFLIKGRPGDSTLVQAKVVGMSYESCPNKPEIDVVPAVICVKGMVTGVADQRQEHAKLPGFGILNNYPNPFNPETTITFYSSESGPVQVSIVNIKGEEVCLVHEGELPAGTEYSWTWRPDKLPSGIYFIWARSKKVFYSKKMMLVR